MRQLAVVPFTGFRRGQDAHLPAEGIEGARERKLPADEPLPPLRMEWTGKNGETFAGDVPPYADPFVRAIGFDATAELFLKLGGSKVYAPNNRTNSGLVASAIGGEAALALGCAIGRGLFGVPIGNDFLARHMRGKGVAINEIARSIRCKAETVAALLTPYRNQAPFGFDRRPNREAAE